MEQELRYLGPETLTTPSYTITIEHGCPGEWVTCDEVKYVGVSKKTGKSITLMGKTYHAIGDGVTHAHFLRYLVQNGKTIYFVGADGLLEVIRGGVVLIEKIGQWNYSQLSWAERLRQSSHYAMHRQNYDCRTPDASCCCCRLALGTSTAQFRLLSYLYNGERCRHHPPVLAAPPGPAGVGQRCTGQIDQLAFH